MDLTHIQRVAEEPGWSVALAGQEDGDGVFFDADYGGVLQSLLQALEWRAERSGGRRDWGWVEEGLERVDRAGTHGWWASVDLGSHLDADLFEDDDHGGPREALLAALAWRRRVGRGGGGGGGGGDRPKGGAPRTDGGGRAPRKAGGRPPRGEKGKRGGGGPPPGDADRRPPRKRSRRPRSRPPRPS